MSNVPDFTAWLAANFRNTTEPAIIRGKMDQYFTSLPSGKTIPDFLSSIGCSGLTQPSSAGTTTPQPGIDLSKLFSGDTGKYLLYGLGGFVLLKMFRIIR